MTTVEAWRDHVAPGEEWRMDAACRDTDPEAFFPNPNASAPLAMKLCGSCVVRQACLDWSIETRQAFGLWGGVSEQERRRMMAPADKPIPTECENGHSWLVRGNLHIRPNGHRMCRVCVRERKRERDERERAA